MIYYANGGFNWNDLYFMPIKLREFYWRELLRAKEEEKEQIQKVNNSPKQSNLSKTRRR
jgi:hypothetical protein